MFPYGTVPGRWSPLDMVLPGYISLFLAAENRLSP